MELTAAAILAIRDLTHQAATQALSVSLTLPYNGNSESYEFETVAGASGRVLGDAVQPFRPAELEVTTLTGLRDAISAGVCGDIASGKIIHVEDFLNVAVKSVAADKFGVRDTLLKATHTPVDAFKFDQYYDDPERFIIALQVAFLQTEQLLWLIKVVSNLKAENGIGTSDNGVNQVLNVKRGEVKVEEVQVNPRIKLVPLRSFAEANESNPVESEFLLRFKQGQAGQPTVALYSIDGQKYKAEIMRSIKRYLEKHLTGVPILA